MCYMTIQGLSCYMIMIVKVNRNVNMNIIMNMNKTQYEYTVEPHFSEHPWDQGQTFVQERLFVQGGVGY